MRPATSVPIPSPMSEALTSVDTCDGATPASEPATSQKPIAAGTTATIHNSAATVSRRQMAGVGAVTIEQKSRHRQPSAAMLGLLYI